MATKTPWANLKSGAGPQSRDGDEVLVGWDIVRNKMVYRLNGGPPHDVARHIQAMTTNPTKTAMTLSTSTSRNAKPPTTRN